MHEDAHSAGYPAWRLSPAEAQCGMARLKVSIVLDSGARIGPGKAKLLESIRETGSISAALRRTRDGDRIQGASRQRRRGWRKPLRRLRRAAIPHGLRPARLPFLRLRCRAGDG